MRLPKNLLVLLVAVAYFGLLTNCRAGEPDPEPEVSGIVGQAAPTTAADEVLLSYNLPKDGNVSIVVFDEKGGVVRELLHGAPRKKGNNAEVWDCLDDWGKPVPAGAYTWKLLLTQGLKAEYLLTLGINPEPRWDTWPGNHGGVCSVAVDPDGMYLACGCGEGTILALKQTLDGKRIWNINHWLDPWVGGVSMAVANGTLFMLQQNEKIQRINAADGKRNATWDTLWEGDDRKESKNRSQDLDAHGDQLVLSYQQHNVVRWLDPDTGKVIDEAPIPEPVGVAVDPAGRVLVITKDTVVAISRKNKTPTVLIKDLVEPHRLDIEDKTGEIFLAERGDSQQVKRFSKDGKLLQAYGIKGGRVQEGRYNPMGFAGISDIAADQTGGFIAIEANVGPRRTVRFNRNGKLLREWYGGQRYSNFGGIDPVDPKVAWIQCAWGYVIRATVDYDKKTWKVHTVFRGEPGDVRVHDGQTYLVATSMSKPMVHRVDLKNSKLVKVADLSEGYKLGGWSLGQGFTLYGMAGKKVCRVAVKEWKDGAPIYQKEPEVVGEIPDSEWPIGCSRGFNNIAEAADGSIYYADNGNLQPHHGVGWWAATTGSNRLIKWDNTGKHQWTVGKHAPAHDALPGEAKFFWGPMGAVGDCIVVRDVEWPMHVWDKDGLWVGGLFDNPDTEAAPKEAYTGCSESFFGSLYTVPERARAPGLKAGDLLFVGSGQNNNPIYRIRGLDDIQRYSGAFIISPEKANKVAENLQAEMNRPDLVRIPHIGLGYMGVISVDGKIGNRDWRNIKPLEIKDGDEVRAKVYIAWETIGAHMNARHGLCVAFDVTTDKPWKSASEPERAFEGGASVEIRLGPVDSDRDAAGPGDIRYIAAPVGLDGKTVAVELMPKLPPHWGNNRRKPVTYKGEGGEITYDRVQTMSANYVAATTKEDGTGYIVEMLIPVRPPHVIKPGLRFRIDASIVLANADGTKAVKRLVLISTDPADATVGDTRANAILRPQNWADALLE